MTNARAIVFAAPALCALLLLGCAITPEDGETRFHALLIGIEDYVNVPPLFWCVDDATGLYDALVACGWNPGDITLLSDSEATKANILNAIASILSGAGEKDYVFVYYSGHGTVVPDTDGDEADGSDEAIVPVDAAFLPPPNDTTIDVGTLILDDELRELFRESKTEKGLVIFDSCNSGGVINKSIESPAGPNRASPRTFVRTGAGARDLGGRGANGDLDILDLPVLAASGQGELSWEIDSLGHGVFTYFLLDGLQNRRADANGDGKVSIRELFAHAERHTVSYAESHLPFPQNPQMRFSRDFIDILVTR